MSYTQQELKSHYKEWLRESQLRQIYTISSITATLYLVLAFLDGYIAPPEIYRVVLFFHLVLIPLLLYSIAFLAYKKIYYRAMLLLLMFAPIAAAVIHGCVTSHFKMFSVYHVEIYLMVFWVFTVSGLELKEATIVASVVSLISIWSVLFIENLKIQEFVMHLFWLSATFIFGYAGGRLLNRSRKNLFEYHITLSEELQNKNVLLKELAHRVKNNLQIVSGVLHTNLTKVEDEEARDVLQNSIQTVHSMGVLHEKLYQSESLEVVDFHDYLSTLIAYIKQTTSYSSVNFEVSSQNIFISLKNAIPLGLVVNEILTNSVKYAFDDVGRVQPNIIKIRIYKNSHEDVVLEISDNGVGIEMEKLNKRYGMKLIDSLVVYQLKGEVSYLELEEGFGYKIVFSDTPH